MMKKNKKGIELTLNAVIIGALILIVLVVLVLILTGSFSKIVPQLDAFTTCEGRGGKCSPTTCEQGWTSIPLFGGCGNPKDPQKASTPNCCIPQGGEGQ